MEMDIDSSVLKLSIQRIYQAIINPELFEEVIEGIAQSIDAGDASLTVNVEYLAECRSGKNHHRGSKKIEGASVKGIEAKSFNVFDCDLNGERYLEARYIGNGVEYVIRFSEITSCLITVKLQLDFLNLLHPHFKDFFRLSSLFGVTDVFSDISGDLLNYVNRPVWVVTSSLRLIYQNRSALEWMRKDDSFILSGGNFESLDREFNTRLSNKVIDICDKNSSKTGFLSEFTSRYSELLKIEVDKNNGYFCLTPIKSIDEFGPREFSVCVLDP